MSRRRFVVILPILWMVASWVSFHHPGDEYGLYVVANFLGSWTAMLLPAGDIHDLSVRLSVTLAGGALVALAGWSLDRLRVPLRLWLILWSVLGGLFLYGFIGSFDSVDAALAKNGSWTAYVAASSNLALTFTTMLCLFGGAAVAARRRMLAQGTMVGGTQGRGGGPHDAGGRR